MRAATIPPEKRSRSLAWYHANKHRARKRNRSQYLRDYYAANGPAIRHAMKCGITVREARRAISERAS